MSNVLPFTPRPDQRPATPEQPNGEGGISEPTQLDRAVYTVKETSHLLSLSLGSTYALIRSGDIPATKLGGRWVVPKKRLHDWLNNAPTGTDG